MTVITPSAYERARMEWWNGGRVGPEPRREDYPDDPFAPMPGPWDPNNRPVPLSPLEQMIARDRTAWGSFLRQQAQASGVPWDVADLDAVIAQIREPGNAGKDPQEFLQGKSDEIKGRSGQPQAPPPGGYRGPQLPGGAGGTPSPQPQHPGNLPAGETMPLRFDPQTGRYGPPPGERPPVIYNFDAPLPGGAGGTPSPPPPYTPPPSQGTSGDQTGDDTGDETDPNPFGSKTTDKPGSGPAPTDPAQHAMIERDKGIWEDRLRNEARAAGVDYDPSDLEGILRQLRYAENAGKDPEIFVSQAVQRYKDRAVNAPGGMVPQVDLPTSLNVDRPGTMEDLLTTPQYAAPYTYQAENLTTPTSVIGDFQGSIPATPGIENYAAADPYGAATYRAPVPFGMPTATDMAADPGYQFRLQQGQEALERSGAARGVTRTGGTLKDIVDYGQRAASQEYGNVYNRMAGQYGMNEALRGQAFDRDEANRMAAHQTTEGGRLGAYQTMAGQRQQDFSNRYNNWMGSYNQWRQQGQDRFNEQYSLATS